MRFAIRSRAHLGGLAVAMSLVLCGAIFAARADASAPIKSFRMQPSSTQAGGHPDLLLEAELVPLGELPPQLCGCNMARDITVNTPPGVIAAPRRLPRCTAAEFALTACPTDSQIGLAVAHLFNIRSFLPVYNMVPRPGQAGLVANPTPILSEAPIYTSFTARTEDNDDYGLEAKVFGISVPLKKFAAIFWGVPGDPAHDVLRMPPGGWRPFITFGPMEVRCDVDPTDLLFSTGAFPTSVCAQRNQETPEFNSPIEPFTLAPTACGGPLTATLETLASDLETEFAQAPFPAITGCDLLSFDPSLSAQPTTADADSASGLDVVLDVPQRSSPDTPSASQIRTQTVLLPEGFTVNAGAANGKLACTEEQARFGTREEAQCPEFAKIGTLVAESTSLPGPLHGAAYLGEPLPGNRYRIFLVADGFGLHVKIPGTVVPDPATGRLKTVVPFPPAPLQKATLHLFGAERGLLATPTQCGTYAVESQFEPWAAPHVPEQSSTQFFEIESGPGGTPCPPAVRPLEPKLNAGVTDNTAGAHTEFVFDLTREDGDQNLTGLEVSTPPGFSGVLAGIPYCPEATIEALAQSSYLGATEKSSPACPASQVGTSIASAGVGSRPVSLEGRVYLAGPYKGAPLSLAVVTPGVSGPYDLGNVVVRAAIEVDPRTADISTVSDPLPRIVEGVPLRVRRVMVRLDRPDFALNPTNCSPLSVAARVSGDQGGLAELRNHFQVANCGTLDFAPKLSLRLRGSTKRRGHPALRSVLTASRGHANLAGAVVAMPPAQLLDNAHIGTVCTRVQFRAEACPKRSIIGTAVAETPLLAEPLRGKVYLRSSENPLPDLVVALKGQVDFELAGRIDTTRAGGLRTTFDTAPDAPVSRFVLNLQGGSKGLLFNSVDLCRFPQKASVTLRGQNGKRIGRRVPLQTSCAKAKTNKKRRAGVSATRKAG